MKHKAKRRVAGNKIIDDIRYALTSKPVVLILSLSAAIRFLFQFLILPNSPSALGPDEGTYARLANYVSQGLPVEEFPIYGPRLYNSSRSTTLPSAFLIKIGLDELTAVRTVASVYGITSTFLLVLCFIAYLKLRNRTIKELSSTLNKKFLFMLGLFAFLPSNFVWSTLGLRESGSQFWSIATFYLLLKLLNSNSGNSFKFTVLSATALTLAYGARPSTALVFSVVALSLFVAVLIKCRRFTPLIAIVLAIFAGQAFTATPTTPTTPTKINLFDPVQSLLVVLTYLENKRNENTFEAQSALPKSACSSTAKDLVKILKCTLFEFSYRLFAFLFRPLILFDQGSKTLTLAALENLSWLILIPLSIWLSLRKKENAVDRFINLGLTSYVIVFASAAALYEGNMGTAFRHKSTILWPLVFILMIAPNVLPKLRSKFTFAS